MAKARRGRLTLTLYLNKFTMHNLTIDHHRLEISQLVLELALLILAAKEVDSLMHGVALSTDLYCAIFA